MIQVYRKPTSHKWFYSTTIKFRLRQFQKAFQCPTRSYHWVWINNFREYSDLWNWTIPVSWIDRNQQKKTSHRLLLPIECGWC
jgi:hypothetical protein